MKNDTQTAAEKDQAALTAREPDLIAKYPHVLAGTIQRGTGNHAGKITVQIQCQREGCKASPRTVCLQDLFQVRYCESCKKIVARVARKKKAGAASPAVPVATSPAPTAKKPAKGEKKPGKGKKKPGRATKSKA